MTIRRARGRAADRDRGRLTETEGRRERKKYMKIISYTKRQKFRLL